MNYILLTLGFLIVSFLLQLFIRGKIFNKNNYYKFGIIFIVVSFCIGITFLIVAINLI